MVGQSIFTTAKRESVLTTVDRVGLKKLGKYVLTTAKRIERLGALSSHLVLMT